MQHKAIMTRKDSARIQSATCRNNAGITPKHSFGSRAMSAAYRNFPTSNTRNSPKGSSSSQIKLIISAALITALSIDGYFYSFKNTTFLLGKILELGKNTGEYIAKEALHQATSAYSYISTTWPPFFPSIKSTADNIYQKVSEAELPISETTRNDLIQAKHYVTEEASHKATEAYNYVSNNLPYFFSTVRTAIEALVNKTVEYYSNVGNGK